MSLNPVLLFFDYSHDSELTIISRGAGLIAGVSCIRIATVLPFTPVINALAIALLLAATALFIYAPHWYQSRRAKNSISALHRNKEQEIICRSLNAALSKLKESPDDQSVLDDVERATTSLDRLQKECNFLHFKRAKCKS